jgi:hypothetical protein
MTVAVPIVKHSQLSLGIINSMCFQICQFIGKDILLLTLIFNCFISIPYIQINICFAISSKFYEACLVQI